MALFRLLRPILHRLPAEPVHQATLVSLRILGASGVLRRAVRGWLGPAVRDPVRLWDLEFPNRVGLAAGYDKDATGWQGLASLGFGHLELGTVTPDPQPGNPRPRVFRLREDEALINRLGFPSQGADALVARLPPVRERGPGTVLGVNLGKQKATPLAAAQQDYGRLLRRLADRADYVAVNVSSPNTPELRRLQTPERLRALVRHLVGVREEIGGRRVPLLVKLAPDLQPAELDAAIESLLEAGADGLILTNTTVSRPPSLRSPFAGEAGGLSGAPLGPMALTVLERVAARVGGRVPIVAVGGIGCGDDARRRRDAGASLLQLYTGLVYRGPALVREVALAARG